MKKILSLLMASIITVSNASYLSVEAQQNSNINIDVFEEIKVNPELCVEFDSTEMIATYKDRGMGCVSDYSNQSMEKIEPISPDALKEYRDVNPGTSIDLSTSQYFPPIGDQGPYSSCVSWATAYYQFTYEANKYNNIVTTEGNAYSPAFMFNMLNRGGNNGSNNIAAYRVLKNQGCLKMSENPYNINNHSYSWSNNVDALISALDTRVTYTNLINISTLNDKITYCNDSQLREVKQLLSSGKIINVEVYATSSLSNWEFRTIYSGGNSGDIAAVWATEEPDFDDGHSMTIVGYDNNITCDINGDGLISACERGAFKVANSWGDDWANDGYIWVMYDALNKVSATNLSVNNRISIFDRTTNSSNNFYSIEVGNYPVNLVGLLNVNLNNRYGLSINIQKDNTQANVLQNTSSNYATFNGTIVFDYLNMDDDIIENLDSTWGITIKNGTNSNMANPFSFKIVDNLYSPTEAVNSTINKQLHLVKDFGVIASSLSPNTSDRELFQLDLQLGDIDYNGVITSNDAALMQNYSVALVELSNLQLQLADVNRDGIVDIADVIIINQMVQ